jgi:hypothetical protein
MFYCKYFSALLYVIVIVHENEEGMELNGDIRLCLYMERNITKRNSEAQLDLSTEAGLKLNADESVCLCLITRMQNKIIKVATNSLTLELPVRSTMYLIGTFRVILLISFTLKYDYFYKPKVLKKKLILCQFRGLNEHCI